MRQNRLITAKAGLPHTHVLFADVYAAQVQFKII